MKACDDAVVPQTRVLALHLRHGLRAALLTSGKKTIEYEPP